MVSPMVYAFLATARYYELIKLLRFSASILGELVTIVSFVGKEIGHFAPYDELMHACDARMNTIIWTGDSVGHVRNILRVSINIFTKALT